MSVYTLMGIGLILGLVIGLLIAAAARGGGKRRVSDARAAGMAEGLALAASETKEEEEPAPEPEEEADGDEDGSDEDTGPADEVEEEGEPEEEVAPVVVQCPQCDTYNNVTTGQRPYEFRCEKCNALLRLKE
jgi:hypothetical protein